MEQRRARRRSTTTTVIQPKVGIDKTVRTPHQTSAPSPQVAEQEKLYSIELFKGKDAVEVIEYKSPYERVLVAHKNFNIPFLSSHLKPSKIVEKIENLCREVNDKFTSYPSPSRTRRVASGGNLNE